MNFNVNFHSSIRLQGEKAVVYIDPLHIAGKPIDADIVLITHPHGDHLSPEDIKKVIKNTTVFVAPKDCLEKLEMSGINIKDKSITADITQQKIIELKKFNIKIEYFRMYNINKYRSPGVPYHIKEQNWAGYVVTVDGTRYCYPGDSEATPELLAQKNIDVLFIPIDGKYTMTPAEAAECTNKIKPKTVVPVHYNSLSGDKQTADGFVKLVSKDINCRVFY